MSSSFRSARKTISAARSQRPSTAFAPKVTRVPKDVNFTAEEQQQLSATSRINAELSTYPAAYQRQIKIP